MADTALLKLQYEFLNTPLADMAKEMNVPVSVMEQEAKNGNWIRRFPDTLPELADPSAATEEELALYQEQFMDLNQKRLKIYNLAKELFLAHRYLTLENAILVSAAALAEAIDITPKDLKALSSLYKDMASGTSLGNISAIQIGEDANGMPTAIIRDLSGGNRG